MAKKIKNQFDPEGAGYDYETFKEFKLALDNMGNKPDILRESMMILWGKMNPRFKRVVALEENKGNKIVKKNKRYYTVIA